MSAREKIAKLESLLARVRGRAETAHEARSGSGAYPVPSRTVVPSSTVVEEPTRQTPTIRPEPESVPAVLVAAATPVVSIPPLPETSGWSAPPPEAAVEAEPAAEATAPPVADDSDVDVEVSTEVVEIDIDEPGLIAVDRGFAPAESGAQLVAEQAHEEAVHDDLDDDLASAPTSIPPEYVEPPPPPANEVLEPEPSSSPRPIEDAYAAVEHAYEEESAPRHTPPPESGKQVAAASVRPEALRKSSVPPPDALGDNTLVGVTSPVGAWREPGISVPPPASARGSRIPPSAAPPTVNLSPEVTRPAVASDVEVVRMDGALASFTPATFGDLLDATLSL